MLTLRQARAIALRLPGASEEPHHERPSFRVAGRIFATVPDDEHLNIMIDSDEVDAATAADPAGCSRLFWGKRLRGVQVYLPAADPDLVADLLSDAWRRRKSR